MTVVQQHCGIYLQIPADFKEFSDYDLDQIVGLESVLSALFRKPEQGAYDENVVHQLMNVCHKHKVAFLIEDEPAFADKIKADGIHFDYAGFEQKQVQQIMANRDAFSNTGVLCGLSRHDAMVWAEAGADYVAFGLDDNNPETVRERREMVAWWAELFEIPCVAWNVETVEEAETLALLGADFVAIDLKIWSDDGRSFEKIRTLDSRFDDS